MVLSIYTGKTVTASLPKDTGMLQPLLWFGPCKRLVRIFHREEWHGFYSWTILPHSGSWAAPQESEGWQWDGGLSSAAERTSSLLWTECVSLQSQMWLYLEEELLGGDLVVKVKPLWMRLVSLQRTPRRAPSPLPPCENIAGRPLSMNQGASSHQTPNLLAPWSWISQPSKLWKINVLFKPPTLWYFVIAACTD